MPLISIVIPSRNGAGKLSYVLPQYKNQINNDFEIIIANDNDEDSDQFQNTIVHASHDVFIVDTYGKGAANARNKGAEQASGEYILFVGDDCIPDRSLVYAYQHFIASNPHIDAVQGFTPFHPSVMDTYFMQFLDRSGLQANWYSLLDEKNNWKQDATGFCLTTNFLIKKSVFIETGMFDSKFKRAAWEDVEFGNRLAARGVRTAYLPEAQTFHWHKYKFTDYVNRQKAEGINRITFATIHPEVASNILDVAGIKKAVQEYDSQAEIINRCIDLIYSSTRNPESREAGENYLKSALSLFSFIGVLDAIRDTPFIMLTQCNNGMSAVHMATAIKAIELDNYAYAQHCIGWMKSSEGHNDNTLAFESFIHNSFDEIDKAKQILGNVTSSNTWIDYVKELVNVDNI